jgi:hypothetical protein
MKQFKKDNTYYCLTKDWGYRGHTISISNEIFNNGNPLYILLELEFQHNSNNITNVNYDCIYHKYPINHRISFHLKSNERIIFYDTDNNKYFEFSKDGLNHELKEADTDMMVDVAEYVLINGG